MESKAVFKHQDYMYGMEKTNPQKDMETTNISLKNPGKTTRYDQTY